MDAPHFVGIQVRHIQLLRWRRAVCAAVTRLALARLVAEVAASEHAAARLGHEYAALWAEHQLLWAVFLVEAGHLPPGRYGTRDDARESKGGTDQ